MLPRWIYMTKELPKNKSAGNSVLIFDVIENASDQVDASARYPSDSSARLPHVTRNAT